jgi:pimeloyl-ACP methyl ester carboxylesterase
MAIITHQKLGSPEIEVEIWKPETRHFRTPLLFIHGSFGGSWMWERFLNFFSSKGWACYGPTLRGHNKDSLVDLSRIHMQDYVSDIASAASLLTTAPVVIGHSMGGLVGLMFAANHPTEAIITIDPSPPAESAPFNLSETEIKKIPLVYTPLELGLPQQLDKLQEALPDIPEIILRKLPQILGPESGTARKERKKGISIPPEKIKAPLLCIAAELGDSVPFGIGAEKTRKTAQVFGADFILIPGASHPGIILGRHWSEAAYTIQHWLEKHNII